MLRTAVMRIVPEGMVGSRRATVAARKRDSRFGVQVLRVAGQLIVNPFPMKRGADIRAVCPVTRMSARLVGPSFRRMFWGPSRRCAGDHGDSAGCGLARWFGTRPLGSPDGCSALGVPSDLRTGIAGNEKAFARRAVGTSGRAVPRLGGGRERLPIASCARSDRV